MLNGVITREFDSCCFFFFFFQAEDGIRDLTVTGVQTCALPIASRAVVVPAGGVLAYTVSKVGVIALAQALARELGPHGVTVNAVLPSTMDTPANRAAMPDSDRRGWVPVEAVADAIAMLAREQSAHITGTLLAV